MKRRSFFGTLVGLALAPFAVRRKKEGGHFAGITEEDARKICESPDHSWVQISGVPTAEDTDRLLRLIEERQRQGIINRAVYMENWFFEDN